MHDKPSDCSCSLAVPPHMVSLMYREHIMPTEIILVDITSPKLRECGVLLDVPSHAKCHYVLIICQFSGLESSG